MKDVIADSPFAGIRVLAVARVVAAPFSTYQLALHGADVISIEAADGKGDQARCTGNAKSKEYIKHLMAPHFLSHASNKRSITLNLSSERGKEVFLKLAKTADVVVENFRTGSMERKGIGYSVLSELNPRLIYCALTGYGQTGPKRYDAAIDPSIQAGSGMMSITGSSQSGPMKMGAPITDYFAGLGMALGIVTALFHREKTGKGQFVDVSLLEAAIVMMSNVVGETLATGTNPELIGNRSPFNAPTTDCFQCKEGALTISAGQDNKRPLLWKVLNRPDIPADPRFSTREACVKNIDALHEEMARTLKERTADEWEILMSAEGLSVMKVRSITEIAEHPHIKERGLFHTYKDVAGLGLSAQVAKSFYRLSASPAQITSEPPRLGQHTDQVLSDLGYSASDIEAFRNGGDI